jgi:hypothetical protein
VELSARARPENKNGFTIFADHSSNEVIRWLDLESIGTPSEFVSGSGIAVADEIYPKRVLDFGREPMWLNGNRLFRRRSAHHF